MRSFLGARALAARENRLLSYTWDHRSANMNADLTDLWVVSEPHRSPLTASVAALPHKFLGASLESWPPGALARRTLSMRTGDYIVDEQGRRLDWGAQLRVLEPVDHVRQRIMRMWDQLGDDPFVGVMIRAHGSSHPRTLEASPVSWFEDYMDTLRDAHPYLRFYISSDAPEVSARLCRRFPGSVTQTDKGGYNSTEGVQAAVVDLYLLAASCGVLQPFWSSFPAMAKELCRHEVPFVDSQFDGTALQHSLVAKAQHPLRPWLRVPTPGRER